MFCPQCRTSLPDGARFCAACGAQLPAMPAAAPAAVATVQYCANCGAELGGGKRFCNRCGAPAATPRTPGAAAGVPVPAASGPHGNGVVPAGAAGSFVTPRAGPATGGGVSGVFQGMSGLTIAVLAGFAVAVAVIGLLQVWYITDEGGEFSNVGIGLWAVIAGGAVAAVCSYMEANGKTFGGRA